MAKRKAASDAQAESKIPKETKKSDEADSEAPSTDDTEETFTTDRKTADGREPNLKVVSFNIGGLKAWIKKGGLEYLQKEDADVYFLSETKVTESNAPPEAKLEGYHTYWYGATEKKGYASTALYSKIKPSNVTFGMNIEKHDQEGRLITAEYEKYYVVGSYVPNSGRKLVRLEYRQEWDKDFLEYIKGLDAKKPVIYVGDLNVAHEEIDLKNPKSNKNKTPGFADEEREGFTELLNAGFVDSFRHLYPEREGAYSFWTYMGNCRAKNVGWRLDYCVISKRLVPDLAESAMRTKVMGSDHCPVATYLAIK